MGGEGLEKKGRGIETAGHQRKATRMQAKLKNCYAPSEDVVARDIQGELILVPLTAGVGDMEDTIFSLNATGRAIWKLLNGTRSLEEIGLCLCAEYRGPAASIKRDIEGLVDELLKRKMVVKAVRK